MSISPQVNDRPNLGNPGFEAYTIERRRYWDEFARSLRPQKGLRAFYQKQLTALYCSIIPPGSRVLELGSGQGELLSALQPAYGVGIELSSVFVEQARQRHPHLHFLQGDVHLLNLDEQFDYIICSDLVNDLWDVLQVLERLLPHCQGSTRLILNAYSRVWELPRRLAEKLGLVKKQLAQNWLTANDLNNLLYLAGFESIRSFTAILCPVYFPLLGVLLNRYLGRIWPFDQLGLANLMVARPRPQPKSVEPVVSVIVPARNEEGNIPQIFERIPEMGAGTELVFVEGHSKDDTYGAIERAMQKFPQVRAKLITQPGIGKGDAVRAAASQASGDLFMILDADLTVAPEDLPRFYQAWRSGKAEMVNGVRLVYPMDERAMRFMNQVANKFFSLAFTWLLSQSVKDTLCGTKVLSRSHYEMILANRHWFGAIDPFGDFDLLFGAAKYNLRIVDLPIRYGARKYGETNIQRWRHGWLLLKMVMVALRRLKFAL
jgi:SAM-dependent methyltransferase